jgi:tetratricopeptide (TPR) repeat protein
MEILRAHVDELPSQSFRERLTRGLENVLDIFRHRPPLVIYGPGGVGKSTLLAEFVLKHAGPDEQDPVPFIYLDFDRAQLDPLHPDTIVQEAFRQISIQFPRFSEAATSLESETMGRMGIEDREDIAKSEHYGSSVRLRKALDNLLGDVSASYKKNLLLFIDTFEIVQRRGRSPVFNVLVLAGELSNLRSSVRVVIAGRAPLRNSDFSFADDFPTWKPLALEGFDERAGRAYLEGRLKKLGVLNVSQGSLDRIVKLVQGNPLSLRLAAHVFAKEGLNALEDTIDQARFDVAFTEERIQGVLHNRIVAYLPPRLRAIADPGLVVRRITPAVIAEVLNGPCGLHVDNSSEADQLFEELKREVALFEPDGDRSLRHRADVRLVMLPLLREKLGEQARKIDEAAVRFWREQNTPEARAEEIYHLVWLGADRTTLENSWLRGPVATLALEDALDEFEVLEGSPSAQVWLCAKLGREISSELEQKASLADWEQNAELTARSLLSSGAAEEALKVLRSREGRTPASSLWLLELEALKLLGRNEEAFQVVDRALKCDDLVGAPAHILKLLMQKASLFERTDQPEEGLICMLRAYKLAHMLGKSDLEFETGVSLARLLRKTNHNKEEEELRQKLAVMLSVPTFANTLTERPALLIEASAEIGDLRPELFIMFAEKVGSHVPGGRGSILGNLGAIYIKRGELDRAEQCLQEALEVSRKVGDRTTEAKALGNLGILYTKLGRLEKASTYFLTQLRIVHDLGDRLGEGTAAYNFAITLDAVGDREHATIMMRAAATILGQLGSPLAKSAAEWLAGTRGLEQQKISVESSERDSKVVQELRDSAQQTVDRQLKQRLK